MKKIYIRNHLGLGDHVICLGLYRSLALHSEEIVIPVRSTNFKSVNFFLRDLKNVRIVKFPTEIAEDCMIFFGFFAQKIGFEELKLGHWGSNFMNEKRFDESFYLQAGVTFENRWSWFNYDRDLVEELELFQSYDVNPGDYIFLHEDEKRNFKIDRDLIQSNLKVVQPRLGRKTKSLASYRYLIENAAQIHVIESSFAAYSDSFEVKGSRFAHRYARPEAMRNPLHEFSYSHNWTVFCKPTNVL